MKNSIQPDSASAIAPNAIVLRSINAAEDISNMKEKPVNSRRQKTVFVEDALDQSFVMRKLALAMAIVEVGATLAACKVADKAVAATGQLLVRVGAACSGAGKRALSRHQASTTAAQK